MRYRLRVVQILLALACGTLLGFHFWDYIYSGSADLAHHYVLVARLEEFGHLPASYDPSLGEMRVYPQLTHQLAAILARVWGSPLAGMQLVVLLSMIAIWTAIGCMLWCQPRWQARSTTLVALVGLILATGFLRLNFWGSEVVGNYFFAEFFSQAIALVVLAFALSRSQAGWSRFAVYSILIVGIVVTECAHLLPAVELLGFLWLLAVFDQFWCADRWSRRSLCLTAIFLLLSLTAVVANPVFKAMAAISVVNGELPLSYVPNNSVLLAVVLATVASSLLALRYWCKLNDPERQRERLVVKYFALLGLSISILCLLQFAALALGRGSDYACRKYAFGLWTILLVNISLLIVWSDPSRERAASRPWNAAIIFDYCAIALLVGGAMLAVFPRQKYLSLSDLISTERRLAAIKVALPVSAKGKSTYAIQLPGEPPIVDYLFSLGIFKAARSANTIDILLNKDLSDTSQVGFIVAGKGTSRYDTDACRLASSDPGLAVIDGACVAKHEPSDAVCHGKVSPAALQYMPGFSRAEEQGTWTNDNVAKFHCDMPEGTHSYPTSVRISGFAYVPAGHIQHVGISINGGATRDFVFDASKEGGTLVLPMTKSNAAIEIKFVLPDAISPNALGLSPDTRRLGFYINSIEFIDGDGKPI